MSAHPVPSDSDWDCIEHITCVVEDNIQNNVNPVSVSGPDKCSQIFPLTEMRIDIQKVLNAIPMICVLKFHLFEHGTDPNGGHTQTFKVSQLARQSG